MNDDSRPADPFGVPRTPPPIAPPDWWASIENPDPPDEPWVDQLTVRDSPAPLEGLPSRSKAGVITLLVALGLLAAVALSALIASPGLPALIGILCVPLVLGIRWVVVLLQRGR